MRRLSAFCLAVLLLGPGLAGCGGPAALPGTLTTGDVAAIQRMLDARAHAVLHGDRRAFEHTVGADASASAAWWRNEHALPLVSYTLKILGEPATGGDGSGHYGIDVVESSRLRKVDEGAVRVVHHDTVMRLNHRWVVTADTWDKDAVRAIPWEYGGASVHVAPDVVLVTRGVSPARGRHLLQLVSEAVDEDRSHLPSDVTLPGAVVTMFDTALPLRSVGFDRRELALLGGVTMSMGSLSDTDTPRVVIAPDMVRAADAALTHVLRHELVHVALWDVDSQWSPTWLSEGAAEYFAWQDDPDEELPTDAVDAAYAGQLGTAPSDSRFHAGGAKAWDEHYAQAWWMVEAIARRASPATVVDLMREFGQREWTEQSPAYAQYLQEYTGLTPTALAPAAQRLIVHNFDH